MGIYHSTILLLGLKNTGKTHFLHWLKQRQWQQWPTQDTYHVDHHQCRHSFHFTEYGSAVLSTPMWLQRVFHTEFDVLCVFVDASANREALLETRNLIYDIYLCGKLVGRRLCIIHNCTLQEPLMDFEQRCHLLGTQKIGIECVHIEFNPLHDLRGNILNLLK